MLIEHRGHAPSVHESAYVAPTAVLCGDVVVGAGSRVLHGAVLTAEDGQVRVGRDVVIMENAVVKGRAGHPAVIGDFVLVGPHAHVNGADVRAGAFIATGASLFPGSVVGNGAEIRINGVVQVSTTVEAGSVVPIGWVAVGTPAIVRPPDQHRDIWAVQRDLDFPGTVYGVPRGASMRTIMAGQSEFYGAHLDDVVVGEDPVVDEDVPAEDVLHEESADEELRGNHAIAADTSALTDEDPLPVPDALSTDALATETLAPEALTADAWGERREDGHDDLEHLDDTGEQHTAEPEHSPGAEEVDGIEQDHLPEHAAEAGPDDAAEHGDQAEPSDHTEPGHHGEPGDHAEPSDHSEPGHHTEPDDQPEPHDHTEHAFTPEPDPAR